MGDDVRRLFRYLGLPEPEYHELVAEVTAAEAASRWPVLAAVDDLLARQRAAAGRDEAPRGHRAGAPS